MWLAAPFPMAVFQRFIYPHFGAHRMADAAWHSGLVFMPISFDRQAAGL
jgi:hypothetical protein